jgi:Ca2+-transporting ATPase
MPEQAAITTSLGAESFHSMPLDDLLQTLSVDPKLGLSDEDAKSRLAHYGPNSIPRVKGSFWKVYLAPILNWLINIYIVSSVALLMLYLLIPVNRSENGLLQSSIWIAVVAINCIVAIFQQYRAQKKLEALEKLAAGETRVIRDGSEMKLDPILIVPGDVVKLEQGDKIPADARLVSCSNLTTNEASLTGESVPSTKDYEAELPAAVPITDMSNMIFLGTYVATGRALAVVTRTGAYTEIGKIQRELEALNTGDIPLRKKVNRLAKYLGITALLLLAVSILWEVFLYPLLTNNPIDVTIGNIAGHLELAIPRALTIMPMNIPLLTTIVLLTGVLVMAQHGVIIRDLSAVESLGRVSIICSDKTGTLTRNAMTVKFCWDTQNLYSITGDGYEPSGQIYRLKDSSGIVSFSYEHESKPTDVRASKSLYKLMVCGAIDNDSEIAKKEIPGQGTTWTAIGDPTDAALLALFRKTNLDESDVRKKYKVVKEFPFESELKRVSKICHDGKKFVAFVKGASEVILPRCTTIDGSDRPSKLTTDNAGKIQGYVDSFAAMGYRVISLAYHEMDSFPESEDARDLTEKNLVYLGFACIVDPPRDGAKEAVEIGRASCRERV